MRSVKSVTRAAQKNDYLNQILIILININNYKQVSHCYYWWYKNRGRFRYLKGTSSPLEIMLYFLISLMFSAK